MKYCISLFIICLAILFACNTAKQVKLFSTDNLETNQFIINTDKDTVIQTPGMALVNIPGGSLSPGSGNSVTLEIKEAYTMADIVKAGLNTTSNGQPLSSGGMIYINVKEKDVKINKPIEVAMPSGNLNSGMQLYKGEVNAEGKINWVNPSPLPGNTQLNAFDNGKALFQKLCTGCHAIDTKVIGPPLANFLNRFPLPDKFDINYWGYMAHPYSGILNFDSHTKNDSLIISENTPDTIDKKIVKADTSHSNHGKKEDTDKIEWLHWYACNMSAYSPTTGQGFDISVKDLNDIYKYIQSESERMGLAYPVTPYKDDCFDSCLIYSKRTKFLRELKTITVDKRGNFIKQNGEMTVVIPDPTWAQLPLPPDDFSWKVSPNNYKATYYQFTIETFGWYNIDMLMEELGEKVKESELFVTLTGEWTDRANIFLIIPSYNVYGEGGPANRNPGEYAFFNKNGSLPLPQNEKAFILAVSEKDDKIGYALKEFRTGLKQQLEVEVKEAAKKEFDKAIALLGKRQMSVAVKPAINADSIRAADKQLKDIDRELKETDKLKPRNCDCNCLGEEGLLFLDAVKK
jgi:hypothetical protein